MANNALYRPSVDNAVADMFGMQPNMDRLNMLPRYDRKQGLIAPNALYQLARAFVSPGVAARGGYVSEEDAVNFGGMVGSGGIGASAVMRNPTPGPGKTVGMNNIKGFSAEQLKRFNDWFADSKVRWDSPGDPWHGEPQPVFTGTDAAYSTPSLEAVRSEGRALWFTDSPWEASDYATAKRGHRHLAEGSGPNVRSSFLKMKNPYVMDLKEMGLNKLGGRDDLDFIRIIREAKAKGHDGIILKNVVDPPMYDPLAGPRTDYVVFDPANVKTALGDPFSD